jgi:hypothetical protein
MVSRPLSASRNDVAAWLCRATNQPEDLGVIVVAGVDEWLQDRCWLFSGTFRLAAYQTENERHRAWLAREAARHVQANRPPQIGPLKWFFLAWRIARLVRALIDLYWEATEYMDDAHTTGTPGSSAARTERPALRVFPRDGDGAGIRRTLATRSPGVPEPPRERPLPVVRETRTTDAGDGG